MSDSSAGARRFVIVGDGVAAWMTAAALATSLERSSSSIRVVGESGDSAPEPFPADLVLPLAGGGRPRAWCDEERLLASAHAAFSWGIALGGWADPRGAWFHPFGSLGANLGPVSFHQLVMRLRHDGRELRLADYSLPALAAQAGRFVRPSGNARSVLSTCRYGLHLEARGLADTLRDTALAAGAEQMPGKFAGIERAHSGAISALATEGGQRLEGDLFLDCSRPGLLIGDVGREDWSRWLPCDRRIVARVERGGPPPPYAQAEAHAAGWTQQLPLANSTVITAFYCSDAGGERAVEESLGRAARDAESLPLRFGRLTDAWKGNCVALGPAAATIDPLAVSNLHLLQSALGRLLELLPADRHSEAEAREYNRRSAMELDNARDYAVALYKTNGRHGDAFWDERRAMQVPDSLEYRMRLYERLGRVALYDEEPLDDASWISLFDEQGLRPPRHHPMADGFATADLDGHVARVRAIMVEELKRMPAHGDYLQRLKAGRPPRAAVGRETT